ncbi:unnamed protein product [Symbiodinium necroappetens]|uniref:ABC transporter domain-containing protein n=1 Tax=Symbiodinium necroappetens TaxID=1628268 RepID=A0A812KTK8_9DINO|nr:unnamed protein product [Symbiodinium necroappetens]
MAARSLGGSPHTPESGIPGVRGLRLLPCGLHAAEAALRGWRMKVELAKALWLRPKLLLLDEPTNHLDFRAREWLMEQIAEYPHTAVVVSHDVAFLHEVCKDIIWMTEQRLETLPGKIVSQEDLLRMQRRKPLRFEFRVPSGEDPVSQGISLHDVEFTYGDGAGLSVESLRLSGRSRVVLLGRNGGGKSTFLKLCAGRLEPGRGSVDRTPGLKVGYFSQVTEDLDANSELTAAEFMLKQCREELAEHAGSTHTSRLTASKKALDSSGTSLTKPKASKSVCEKRLLEVARGVLSSHGLDGDLATKVPVDALSGGQKASLKLAVLSQSPAHILLLDEPTNHLDAEACRALAEALAKFPGGIVAVTHDPLLTYRLIHCNWNSSELFLCRDGFLWKQRNFSSHSLKAFQDLPNFWEVYRALGQCYEAEIARLQGPSQGVPSPISLKEEERPDSSSRSIQLGKSLRARRPTIDDLGLGTGAGASASMRESLDERAARATGHKLQQLVPLLPSGHLHCLKAQDLPETEQTVEVCFVPLSNWNSDTSPSVRRRSSVSTLASGQADTTVPKKLAGRSILLPAGILRSTWDVLSLLCLILDLLLWPLDVFSEKWPSAQSSLNGVPLLLPCFWTLDILIAFCTPYYRKGELECRYVQIARRYAGEWLLFDVLYVVVDCVAIFGEQMPRDPMDTLRLTQFLLRLVRLTRMSKMAEGIKSRFKSEMLSANANIVQISVQLLLIHHLTACCWYYVGSWESPGWVSQNLDSATVSYKYSTSLHWTFCQLGFGGTEIEPVNTAERAFGILFALLALAVFSTLLATIASQTATLSKSTEERRRLFRQLGKFLGKHGIPPELSLRIHCFLEHAYNLKQQTLLETTVPLLDLLSKPLRGELQCARYESCLRQLDFVAFLPASCRDDALQRLAHKALQQRTFAATDTIFEAGNVASEAFFLTTGRLEYLLGSATHSVSGHCWLVEMCLWTPWLHLGELSAVEDSEVISVKIEQFHASMRRSYHILNLAQAYAQNYVDAMHGFVLVTDLWRKTSVCAECEEEVRSSVSKRHSASFRSGKPGSVNARHGSNHFSPPSFASAIWQKLFPPTSTDFSRIAPLQ